MLARDCQASKRAFPSQWCLEMGRERGVSLLLSYHGGNVLAPVWTQQHILEAQRWENEPQHNMKQFAKLEKPLPPKYF